MKRIEDIPIRTALLVSLGVVSYVFLNFILGNKKEVLE
jgi:hypothetical protein